MATDSALVMVSPLTAAERDEGQRLRQPVVVVGVHRHTANDTRRPPAHDDCVRQRIEVQPGPPQFGAEVADAVALLQPQVCHVLEAALALAKHAGATNAGTLSMIASPSSVAPCNGAPRSTARAPCIVVERQMRAERLERGDHAARLLAFQVEASQGQAGVRARGRRRPARRRRARRRARRSRAPDRSARPQS